MIELSNQIRDLRLPYRPDQLPCLQAILSGASKRALVICLGGKGGVGKTMAASQVADVYASAGHVLAIDADPANQHFYKGLMRELPSGSREYTPRLATVHAITHRLRAEDHAGRIDPTACQDLMELIQDASDPYIIVDCPAGDTETTQRCSEIIIESCRESDIRLVVAVTVGAVDPTPIDVLRDLEFLLSQADRSVLVKNTAQAVNFTYIERSDIYAKLNGLPNFREIQIAKIGERIIEGLRLGNIPWHTLATETPMRIRVEAARLRQEYHQLWLEALK
ncbi:hypothetical protein [Methylobacterium sp. J-067]|uniref:nucleotide-binding protein n=1 Tax=Methylobacterium sp. J-067 TaxID=2836648 RepID=UPI001FB9A204|nr:hypothetical protein [Methylobacterium sp. J-067]MCJ2025285.1 hypothetical protein [Methylobacterium sp. J-067]